MPNIRLLERIRKMEESPNYRGSVNTNEVVSSILRHLQLLLNSRQGNVAIASDYGTPDFTNLIGNYSTESVKDLTVAIKEVIEKFEPRLRDINVAIDNQVEDLNAALHFKIQCRLATDDDRYVPVTIKTVIDPDGLIKVKS
jgi:type VI secretion system protein